MSKRDAVKNSARDMGHAFAEEELAGTLVVVAVLVGAVSVGLYAVGWWGVEIGVSSYLVIMSPWAVSWQQATARARERRQLAEREAAEAVAAPAPAPRIARRPRPRPTYNGAELHAAVVAAQRRAELDPAPAELPQVTATLPRPMPETAFVPLYADLYGPDPWEH